MLKKLFYILLLHNSLAEKVDIANCNELWGMSNSLNKQAVYSMKIYSCIIEPNYEYNKKLTPIDIINYTNIPNNNISNYTNIPNNTNSNYTNIPNNTNSNYITTPSSSQIDIVYHRGSSPSSKTNKNIDNVNQEDILVLDYSSPSPSSQLNINNTKIDIGLIIGIILSSCIIIIFGILFYRKRRSLNNIIPTESLKSRALIAKPSILNTSHISSNTDETAHISPHPRLPTHISINELKDLPKLPPFNNIVDLESGSKSDIQESTNDGLNNIVDLESGSKSNIDDTAFNIQESTNNGLESGSKSNIDDTALNIQESTNDGLESGSKSNIDDTTLNIQESTNDGLNNINDRDEHLYDNIKLFDV